MIIRVAAKYGTRMAKDAIQAREHPVWALERLRVDLELQFEKACAPNQVTIFRSTAAFPPMAASPLAPAYGPCSSFHPRLECLPASRRFGGATHGDSPVSVDNANLVFTDAPQLCVRRR